MFSIEITKDMALYGWLIWLGVGLSVELFFLIALRDAMTWGSLRNSMGEIGLGVIIWPVVIYFVSQEFREENETLFYKACNKYEKRFGCAPKASMREILKSHSKKSWWRICRDVKSIQE